MSVCPFSPCMGTALHHADARAASKKNHEAHQALTRSGAAPRVKVRVAPRAERVRRKIRSNLSRKFSQIALCRDVARFTLSEARTPAGLTSVSIHRAIGLDRHANREAHEALTHSAMGAPSAPPKGRAPWTTPGKR